MRNTVAAVVLFLVSDAGGYVFGTPVESMEDRSPGERRTPGVKSHWAKAHRKAGDVCSNS
jgi:hypothetical protein